MQKKIIAAAIIGMVSVGASAATVYDKDGLKVSLGGKFDFAVEFKDADSKETLTIADGKYSTSRLTLGAEQAINNDLSAYYSVDMRFNNFFTGKNSATDGGLTTNDAKKGGLKSKKLGTLEAGTINVAAQQFVFKKNYVNAQESEIVKYGVSSMGLESLSNRTVYVATSNQLPVALKGSVSISDNRSTDAAGKKSNMYSYGAEFQVLDKVLTGGAHVVVKPNTNYTGASNELKHYETYLAAEKDGKKISLFASHDSSASNGKSGRGYGINAYYLINKTIDLGVAYQRYDDRSSTGVKNDGNGYMAGVHYYAAKGVAFFYGTRFDNWERKESLANTKIVGTAAGFSGSLSKNDQRTHFAGMNFAF